MFAAEHFLSNIVRDYGSIQSQQMVAHGTDDLKISWIKVSYSFLSEEKPDRKEDTVYQG